VDRLRLRLVDELEFGFGWLSPERPWLRITSNALAADGGVWLIDTADAPALDEPIGALSEAAGVIQLLESAPTRSPRRGDGCSGCRSRPRVRRASDRGRRLRARRHLMVFMRARASAGRPGPRPASRQATARPNAGG
jgi:hypothetical protein